MIILLPLSKPQKSLYNALSFYHDNYPINIGGIIFLNMEVSKNKLLTIMEELVRNSANLRTIFNVDIDVTQEIKSEISFQIDYYEDMNEKELQEYFERPFEIGYKLFRFAYIKEENRLVIVMSHLIGDGYTFKLISENLINLLKGKKSFKYEDINILLEVEKKEFNTNKHLRSKHFFEESLTNEVSYFKPYQDDPVIDKTIINKLKIDKSLTEQINRYLKLNNQSIQTFMIGLISLELMMSNSSNSMRLGITIHNRSNLNKNVLGIISQAYPINFNIKKTFLKTLDNIKLNAIKLYRNKFITYEELIKINKDKVLFDVLVNIQEKFTNDLDFKYEVLYDSKTDLSLIINVYYDNLNKVYEIVNVFKETIFNKKEIDAFNKRLLKRINLIINGSDSINSLILEEKIENSLVLTKPSLLELLNNSFSKYSKQVALVHKNEIITYQELNYQSNLLAQKLIDLKLSEKIILINLNNDISKIIAMLAIIKSNNIFTFLPNGEKESKSLLKELKVSYIINSISLSDEKITNKKFARTTKKLAIYHTSGTTSRFKSVILSEEGIVNYLLQEENFQNDIIKLESLLNLADFSFDIALENIFLSLINGKVLYLSSLELVFEILYKVDFLSTTPTVFKYLLDNSTNDFLTSLKVLVLGGEVLTNSLSEKIKDKYTLKLYNSYGPTECSIAVSTKLITNNVTLGNAINGANIVIFNKRNQILPNGYIGNIAISGISLGFGYLNEGSFSINVNGTDYYLTNDLGYIDSNLELNYLGRLDNQVKRNGIRIEIDYLDKVISELTGVINNKTIFQDDKIISYIETTTLTKELIFNYLLTKLSTNYLPNEIIITNKFKVNQSGKIILNNESNTKLDIKAFNETDEIIFMTIKQLLTIDQIEEDDTFLSLGGSSIDALELVTILRTYNINLPLKVFSNHIKIKEYYQHVNVKDLNLNLLSADINFYLDKKTIKSKHVLLLGSTGFLGMHLLKELLENNFKVTIIVRKNALKSASLRINHYYKYYFNKVLPNTVILLEGEITNNHFGLDEQIYLDLLNNIDTIINTAAKVDFIGMEKDFDLINYQLVKRLERISKEFNLVYYQISTTAMGLLENDFKETSLYQNNTYDNYYLSSKRKAEDYIINNFETNRKTYIIRVGNLMPRSSDYKFQINYQDNFIYQAVNSKISIKSNNIKSLDISSVDLVSKAIVHLIKEPVNLRVLNVFNPNLLIFDENYHYPINNEVTIALLKDRNFTFSKLDRKYLTRVLRDFKKK